MKQNAMKAYGGVNYSWTCWWVVSFMPGCVILGERAPVPQYSFDGRLSGPSSQLRCYAHDLCFLSLPGIKAQFLDCRAYSLVTILTELSCFWKDRWWDTYTDEQTDWQMQRCMNHTCWQTLCHVMHNQVPGRRLNIQQCWNQIQFTFSFLRYTLMLFSCLLLGLEIGRFPRGFFTNILTASLVSLIWTTVYIQPIITSLLWLPWQHWVTCVKEFVT
jgi:hypothetical protein